MICNIFSQTVGREYRVWLNSVLLTLFPYLEPLRTIMYVNDGPAL
jgi:hypothetical protein